MSRSQGTILARRRNLIGYQASTGQCYRGSTSASILCNINFVFRRAEVQALVVPRSTFARARLSKRLDLLRRTSTPRRDLRICTFGGSPRRDKLLLSHYTDVTIPHVSLWVSGINISRGNYHITLLHYRSIYIADNKAMLNSLVKDSICAVRSDNLDRGLLAHVF